MGKHSIQPLGNRILVKREKPLEKKGSIFLPESAKDKPKKGEVVALGKGKLDDQGQLQPIALKIGDRVIFGAYAGNEVKTEIQEDDYLILSEEDVLCVIENN